MTKNELYNTLIEEGESLPPIAKITKAELEAIYAKRHPEEAAEADEAAPEDTKEPEAEQAETNDRPLDALEQHDAESAEAEQEPEQDNAEQEDEAVAPVAAVEFPLLHFSAAGWCSELNRSYFVGWYQPITRDEYDALAPYADGAAND